MFFLLVGGFLLFIIPGIIFIIWFLSGQYVLVSEDLRGFNALLRSKQLIQGNWWRIFWYFFLIILIIVIINFLFLVEIFTFLVLNF